MLEAILAFLLGLLIGSFLNVCIYRWPRDLSVIRPRSHCPECEKTIAWSDNIPLVSYVLLRGRCRFCNARISPRYPAVELITGVLFFVFALALGHSLVAVKLAVFAAMLVVLIFSDLEERILPDEVTLGGFLAGLVFAAFVPAPDVLTEALVQAFGGGNLPHAVQGVAGALAGGLFPALVLWGGGWIYEKIRHREGMGFGDVKLTMMVGAFLGLQGALLTMILGSFAGSVIGYSYIKITHKDASTYELPFGTFLGAAGLVIAILTMKMRIVL